MQSSFTEVRVERRRGWTYELLDQRQRAIAEEIRSHGASGALLLTEVAPVITLGRRTPETDLPLSRADYERLGVSLYPADRGGLGTYHGPGQWVVFCVDFLERLTGDPRGVRKMVEALLDVARLVGESYGVSCEVRSGAEMGVWSKHGKFAAVGVHIENGIVLHGLSVNGFKTPTSFVGLRPCGLDAPVSYLLSDATAFEELGDRIEAEARKRFWHPSC